MKKLNLNSALAAAVKAARAAGKLMRDNLRRVKKVNLSTSHDVKLELDVRCQKLIERQLASAFPGVAFLGEEGDTGNFSGEFRWVVDPIDGTVNYSYGIPHACVSIALQKRKVESRKQNSGEQFESVVGVVYDPFTDELWTAVRGKRALLNGTPIGVSKRAQLNECVVSIGFSKNQAALKSALPYFLWLARRVKKVRMLGAAALGMTYVATGRLDAYIERGINIWDVAAGGLIVECAGGKFWREPIRGNERYRMVASNGLVHRKLPPPK